jgi:hypothetical protein
MAMTKAVLTPERRFASLRLAAVHYGINYETARQRARRGCKGWRYAEPPPPPAIVLASKPTRKLGPRRPKSDDTESR